MYLIKCILYLMQFWTSYTDISFLNFIAYNSYCALQLQSIFFFKSQCIHPCIISFIVSVNRSSYFCTFYHKNARNPFEKRGFFHLILLPPPYSLIMIIVQRCCNGQQTNKYMLTFSNKSIDSIISGQEYFTFQ